MGSEYDSRKNDKSVLFQALNAEAENDIGSFILWMKSQMDADDVKLVQQEFDKKRGR
ncbi:MAG: hypothetical protein FWG90_09930 [Oscillospiraceae bacterium]|nr:hypothetical protein [Oscillospiraceae bacterium]